MSDANRDEILKCKRIGESALSNGDGSKALRFFEKALRMAGGSDPELESLVQDAREAVANGPAPDAAPAEPAAEAQSGPAPTPEPRARETAAAPSGGGQEYTPEQSQQVKMILKSKDYYKILNIDKDADEAKIKSAYKKLALKLHPDKCKAPGAEEAFKKVSKAFQCLTDPQKRQVYDQYGDEESMERHGHGMGGGDFMTPEDLFAAFFGGDLAGGRGGAQGFTFGSGGLGGQGFTVHFGGPGGFQQMHMGGSPFGGMGRQRVVQKAVKCSLEELYRGCTKTEEFKNSTYQLDIKAGTQNGSKFSYQEDGVVFVVEQKPHAIFLRDGDDIKHTITVAPHEWLFGCSYEVKHLDGTRMKIKFSPCAFKPVTYRGKGFGRSGKMLVRASPVDPAVLAQMWSVMKFLWWLFMISLFFRQPSLFFLFLILKRFLIDG